jgi:CHASE3 domain sensor protein
VTIRAKLFAAIALTVLGPLVTIGVALSAFGTLGDRFDDVARAVGAQRVALDLKFAVTDMNGWQTAYGYAGDGSHRRQFEAAASETDELLAQARDVLTHPGAEADLFALEGAFRRFMALDEEAWAALEAGDEAETKRILLGPELELFARMARLADDLAGGAEASAVSAATGFDDARDTAKRQLVAVAIGAGIVIVLLLITVQDVVRLALERREPA